jgi:hypothetical protein
MEAIDLARLSDKRRSCQAIAKLLEWIHLSSTEAMKEL